MVGLGVLGFWFRCLVWGWYDILLTDFEDCLGLLGFGLGSCWFL